MAIRTLFVLINRRGESAGPKDGTGASNENVFDFLQRHIFHLRVYE
jgi:hypothetical protein